MTDFSELMGSLNPKTRKRFQLASERQLERMPTASIGLTMGLNGGIGYGRQTLLWGNKSSGKTSLLLLSIARAQKEGKACALIDAEKSFDPEWAARLGVDNENLIVATTSTVAEFADMGVDLINAGIDVLGVDSISAMIPQSWLEKDELKGLDGTKQIGSKSRDLGNAVNMLNHVNEKTALILISQIRNKITTYGASGQPDGGNAMKFFSTTSIKLMSSASDREQIKGEYQVHDKVFEGPIGRPVEWQIEFNKIGPPSRSGSYDFYYEGDEVGIDNVGEILDLSEKFGLVERRGAWYYIDGTGYQGRAKAIIGIKEQPDIQDMLTKELYG